MASFRADGKYVGIGAAEPQFYELLCDLIGVEQGAIREQRMDPERWPEFKERFSEIFKTRTRDEWSAILEGTDVCFGPVLDFDEAPKHPHNVARGAFVEIDRVVQPAPAPRFSRTASSVPTAPPVAGENNDDALSDGGFTQDEITELKADGVV